MFSRLFKVTQTIGAAAIILGLSGLASRLLGVYRDHLLAASFGAGPILDAYYAAFRIPDFMYNLIVLGALSAGFIPVFSQLAQRSVEKSWRLAQATLLTLGCILAAFCVLGFFFTPTLVSFIAPGFTGDALSTTITITHVLLLSPIILGASGVFGGILQSHKRFLAYSIAPIFYNVGIIIGILFFLKPFGIAGLAWGVILGSTLHLLIQVVVSYRLGWRWKLLLPWREEGMGEIVRLMGPRTLSLAMNEIDLFIATSMASGLAAGSLSTFKLADNLSYVPIGLFGISFAVAAFPVLVDELTVGREKKYRQTLQRTASSIIFFMLPTMAIYLVLGQPIVHVLFGAGEFSNSAVATTALILICMLPHMLAQALLPLYTRAYYAQKNSRFPFYAAFVEVIINYSLSYYLSRHWGVIGLGVALSVASTTELCIILAGPLIKTAYLKQHVIRRDMVLSVLAAILMAATMFGIKLLLASGLALGTIDGALVVAVLAGACGAFVYALCLKLAHSDEYAIYENLLLRKVRGLRRSALPTVAEGEEDDLLR